jgi:hypothetical protein
MHGSAPAFSVGMIARDFDAHHHGDGHERITPDEAARIRTQFELPEPAESAR